MLTLVGKVGLRWLEWAGCCEEDVSRSEGLRVGGG